MPEVAGVRRKWLRYGQPAHGRAPVGRGLRLSVAASWAMGSWATVPIWIHIFRHDCPMDVMTNGEREIDGCGVLFCAAQRISK